MARSADEAVVGAGDGGGGGGGGEGGMGDPWNGP